MQSLDVAQASLVPGSSPQISKAKMVPFPGDFTKKRSPSLVANCRCALSVVESDHREAGHAKGLSSRLQSGEMTTPRLLPSKAKPSEEPNILDNTNITTAVTYSLSDRQTADLSLRRKKFGSKRCMKLINC